MRRARSASGRSRARFPRVHRPPEDAVVELEVVAAARWPRRAPRHATAAGTASSEPPAAEHHDRAREDRPDHPLGGARRLVQIHLLEHEEARGDERLDGRQPLRAVDGEHRGLFAARGGRREPQAAQQPVEVVEPVADARRVRVAQEIVAAVDVELPAHGLREIRQLVAPVDQIDDARRAAQRRPTRAPRAPRWTGRARCARSRSRAAAPPGWRPRRGARAGRDRGRAGTRRRAPRARGRRVIALRLGQHSVDRPQPRE